MIDTSHSLSPFLISPFRWDGGSEDDFGVEG